MKALVPDWPAGPRVRAATTMRALPGASQGPFAAFNLGAHCGDDAGHVQANRVALMSLLDLPSPPAWLRQMHGTQARLIAAPPARDEEALQADAAIARTPGIVLAVLTADCLPLLVCADDGTEIAAIHAGWRGLGAGVIERCIENLRTPHARLLVWLAPAIGPDSYEVGEEVFATFVAQDRTNTQAFVPTCAGHWRCDLYTLAQRRLRSLGVTRIYGGGFDTFADARFYSYRRDGITGRFASLIWIAD